MSKRIISLLTVLSIAAVLFSGCAPTTNEMHKEVFAKLAKDVEAINLQTPATILYDAMQVGKFSITSTDGENTTTYTLHQNVWTGDYKTEVVERGEETIKRGWQLSDGHFLLTSNAYSTSAYGVELAGDSMLHGGFLKVVDIKPGIYQQYYLPRVQKMISQNDAAPASASELISLIGSEIRDENIALTETKWTTGDGKKREGLLVSYDINGEVAAKVWAYLYQVYADNANTRYNQYLNSIFKTCLEANGVVFPEKEIDHMQSAKDSWMREVNYIYTNSKPRVVMEVFYDEDREVVDHAAIYISTTEGTEFVKLRILWERRKVEDGTEFCLTYTVDGPGAMFQDKTVELVWTLTDNDGNYDISQVLTLNTSTETVVQVNAFNYEAAGDQFVWTTNIYNQEVVLSGTATVFGNTSKLSVLQVQIGDSMYPTNITIEAQPGEAVPEAGSYVDLNSMAINQIQDIYDNIMSHIPDISA